MKHARYDETTSSKGAWCVIAVAAFLALASVPFTNHAYSSNAPVTVYVIIVMSLALAGAAMAALEDLVDRPWAWVFGACAKLYGVFAAACALTFAINEHMQRSVS